MNIKKLIMVIIAIIVLAIIGVVIWYNSSLSEVDKKDTSKVQVEIPIGSSAENIATILKNNDLIKNKVAFKLYVKLNKISNFQAGKYELYKTMNVEEITKTLQTGKLYSKNQITITFVEGKNINWYANKIAEETNNTKEQVYELLENKEYISSLIEKYWFLTDEIQNKDIYFPLEGYLFPDTYSFNNKDVTVEEIFDTMLKQTEIVLNEYKDEIEKSKYSVHEILSIASLVETEGIHPEDRKDISSVIYNRLKVKMPLQIDATTYYAVKIELGQRDLYQSELNTYNPYNTRGPRMEGKLPIGPISSVSKISIEAALNPNNTDYIYYVSDKNGKVYFNRTSNEHNNTINRLQNEGLWCEF